MLLLVIGTLMIVPLFLEAIGQFSKMYQGVSQMADTGTGEVPQSWDNLKFNDACLWIRIMQKRAMCLSSAPLPDRLGAGPQAKDQRVRFQTFKIGGINHQSSAGSNYRIVTFNQVRHHLALHLPEYHLAGLAENFRDRHPGMFLNKVVRIHKFKAQFLRHLPTNGRFTSTHEPG